MKEDKNMKKRKPQRWTWQFLIALVLSGAGLTLLFLGFFCPPEGEIHHSVLIAFGEVSTFAGALFGVDYSYKYRYGENKQ